MTEVYLKDGGKILEMLKDARMTETGEDISKLSRNGKTYVVPTNYLNRLMPSNGEYGNQRTIGSLTGFGMGTIVNASKGTSSYAELSQTKPKKNEDYYKSYIPMPRKPKRLFGMD